jgi:hypothetical protein
MMGRKEEGKFSGIQKFNGKRPYRGAFHGNDRRLMAITEGPFKREAAPARKGIYF